MRVDRSTLERKDRRISIIIPAHNASATLPACLEALAQSTTTPFETLIVCDGCSDDTAAIAKQHGARVIEYVGRYGAGYARNVGAAAANGDAFFFIDADCVARPEALAQAAEAVLTEDLAFGSYTIDTRAGGFLTRFKNLQHHYNHQQGADYQTTFWSGCGIVSREAFEKTEGFDIALQACEDIEFGAAAVSHGYRVHLVRTMQVEHLKVYNAVSLLKSDLLQRAIPWTRLIFSGRAGMGVLNTNIVGQVSVAATFLFLAGLAVTPFWLPAALLAVLSLAVVLAANAGLLKLAAKQFGWSGAVASIGPLLAHFAVCGAGYIAGRLSPKLRNTRTSAPRYTWVESQGRPRYSAAHAKTSS